MCKSSGQVQLGGELGADLEHLRFYRSDLGRLRIPQMEQEKKEDELLDYFDWFAIIMIYLQVCKPLH